MKDFLPVDERDMKKRGWSELDFVFVSGDAYVDHPAFGPAIISRVLERHGYKVGVIAQPDCSRKEDFARLGRPRLGFLVSAGNMDSMLNKFTAAKKRRGVDAYSPGGKIGRRPPRAVIAYTNILRKLFPNTPVIIGGIEASLRRTAHYDYWSDTVRRSILVDSMADILVYGMGERAMIEIAAELHRGTPTDAVQDVRGTCFRVPNKDYVFDYVELPSFDEIAGDKNKFAEAFRSEYLEQDAVKGRRLVQQNGEWCVVVNPPALPLTETEMDEIYSLPYMRTYHPMYEKEGGVPAIKEVGFSLTSQRGCFGGCNFCAIVSHEGRVIQRRSRESILDEARLLTTLPGFKGYIHDVGGPTANFREPSCEEQKTRGLCRGKACLSPTPCKNLTADHGDYITLLRSIRALPKIKKVFVRSGIRFDYILLDKKGDAFLEEICRYHISGQMKIAPEHIADKTLRLMGKPPHKNYVEFARKFRRLNERLGKKQYLVPYFMSGHPGTTLADAIALAEFMRDAKIRPRQVQDFIPTPGTLSTCMYHTGLHPLTGERVYVAKTREEKAMQRALMQYFLPENRELVKKALKLAHREDLIGFSPKCLIRPEKTRRK